jgi:hypothetical protein
MQLQFRTEHVDIIGTQQAKQERPHVPKFQGNQQWPCLDSQIHSKFYYVKRRFSVTSKYRHIYGVLNIDKIKN